MSKPIRDLSLSSSLVHNLWMNVSSLLSYLIAYIFHLALHPFPFFSFLWFAITLPRLMSFGYHHQLRVVKLMKKKGYSRKEVCTEYRFFSTFYLLLLRSLPSSLSFQCKTNTNCSTISFRLPLHLGNDISRERIQGRAITRRFRGWLYSRSGIIFIWEISIRSFYHPSVSSHLDIFLLSLWKGSFAWNGY